MPMASRRLAAELKAEIDSAELRRPAVRFRDVAWGAPPRGAPHRKHARPVCPSASSRRRTSAAPSARRWIDWSATSAPRSRSSTTQRAPDCTPRPGCSVATRLRHGVRRLVQPLDQRAARRRRVERAALLSSDTGRCSQKFEATFDSYWNSSEFETYDPDRDRDRLDDALIAARGGRTARPGNHLHLGLEVRPYPVPAGDAGRASRSSASFTIGTATSSSQRPAPARPSSPRWTTTTLRAGERGRRLLFVAHRREILEQSLRTYREVLGDGDFGELYVGGARPERWQHVFASVQSLTSYGVANIPRDAFDVVVIDEFHHAEARDLPAHPRPPQPSELLGLTATPERTDGTDVRSLLRRPHRRRAAAVGRPRRRPAVPVPLLRRRRRHRPAPVTWSRGGYDEADARATSTPATTRARASSCTQLRDKVVDLGAMRALGLLRQRRARRVHGQRLQRRRHPALARQRADPRRERDRALAEPARGEVNVLFAADLFNEGLDIPDVDTVLFLRPTESATVFLQQLGRGLRRTATRRC